MSSVDSVMNLLTEITTASETNVLVITNAKECGDTVTQRSVARLPQTPRKARVRSKSKYFKNNGCC